MSDLLTPADVASKLKLSRQSIYLLLHSGELPGLRVTSGGSWRIDPRDLSEFLERANQKHVLASAVASASAPAVETRGF